MPWKMFRATKHSSLAKSVEKRRAHAPHKFRVRAKTSHLCYGAGWIHMHIQHRRKIQIASRSNQFSANGARDIPHRLRIAQSPQIGWRGPLREWLGQRKSRAAFL